MCCWPAPGAERFAREVGAEQWEEMLTEEIRAALARTRLAAAGATQRGARQFN